MQDEIQGILANKVGRNTENNLTATLERLVGTRPGLLLNGFNVRENLKLFFDAFNIKLKEYSGKGGKGKSAKERTEIEHDILHIAPNKDQVNVLFVQAKSHLKVQLDTDTWVASLHECLDPVVFRCSLLTDAIHYDVYI